MAKAKAVSQKSSQTKDYPDNPAQGLPTIIKVDHESQPKDNLRRSKRLQDKAVSTSATVLSSPTQERSSETMLSTPALLSTKAVLDGALAASDNDSTLVGATDIDETTGDHPSIPTKPVLDKLDTDTFSDYGETDTDDSDDTDDSEDVQDDEQDDEQDDDEDNDACDKPSVAEQAPKFNKRKGSELSVPANKKQKSNEPTAKRQRKPANSKNKTLKGKFLAASAEDTRPLPWGEPEVWAETRPELCEALPWFHCWQGAGHTNRGWVLGMLLDEDQGERAYMDEHIAIARAGGGIGKDGSGRICQIKDQDAEHGRIKAFMNNQTHRLPLFLIIGQRNIHCPSRIPHRYCVGPEVHITDHWEEKSNGHVVVKFRFEKTDHTVKSWYAAEDTPEEYLPTDIQALRNTCASCNVTKPQVFASGWMCLNSKCASFWKIDGILAPEAQEYNPAFLKERSEFDGFLPPYDMEPELIQPQITHGQAFHVTRQCWQGIVCKLCGRCNLRRHWDAWRCRTEGCPFVHKLPMDVIHASTLTGDVGSGYQGHGLSLDKRVEPSITYELQAHGLYHEDVYQLGNGLIITHLISNNTINSAPDGPDDLFRQLQMGDFGLERLRMKNCVVEETYSRHFSHNFGLPYKYVVGHDNSTSLAVAPEAIKEAMRRMTWAAKRHVPEEEFVDFNELLAIGYLETMKMNYHDDGESSLGPTVASLSLGCPALMKWRLKTKYWCGFKDKARKHYDPNQPILPGCRKPEERRRLNELAKTASVAELDAAAQEALKFNKGDSKTSREVLELVLRHGDYMIMHGASMQVYYEHMVAPTDKLRFGLTCRYVKPEMVSEEMRSMGDLTRDPAKAYDGDLKLYEDYMKKCKAKKVTRRRVGYVAPQA